MAVVSMRVAAQYSANACRSRKRGCDTRDSGCGGSYGSGSSGGGCSGIIDDGSGRVQDFKQIVKHEDAQAAALALAPVNEEKAGQRRCLIRAVVKKLIAKGPVSHSILMYADIQTVVFNEEVVKVFEVQANVAHSYLMGAVWFLADGGLPKKKRPISNITKTIPHRVAQIR